jgi:hypothetical protein
MKWITLMAGTKQSGCAVLANGRQVRISDSKSPTTHSTLRLVEVHPISENAVGSEYESSSQWDDILSLALDEAAQPTEVHQDTKTLRALLAENARLRKLAIQLSNMLGDLPT